MGEAIDLTGGESKPVSLTIQTSSSGRPPVPFVGEQTLETESTTYTLTGSVQGGLAGWLSPRAVPSSDGTAFAYNAWEELVTLDPEMSFSQQGVADGDPLGRPSIRIFNIETGDDSLLADGAFSIAWDTRGRLAYFAGDERDFRADQPYSGRIVVRDSLSEQPTAWTSVGGSYVVYGWANDLLLAYQRHPGQHLDVVVLGGPGDTRTLAKGANIVALSPDGTRVLLSEEAGPGLRLLDLASGRELSSLDMASALGPSSGIEWVGYGGSWLGDSVAARTNVGIAILRVTEREIRARRLIRLPPQVFPVGVHEPRLLDESGDRVVAWGPLHQGRRPTYSFVTCDLAQGTCKQGPKRNSRTFSEAYNPSRPR
jgi:hypothetical protein